MTTGVVPICYECLRFHTPRPEAKALTCDAFPAGIPRDILLSRVDHRNPVRGDGGKQFQASSPGNLGARTRNPLLLQTVSAGLGKREILPDAEVK